MAEDLGPDAAYWRYLEDGVFMIQHCRSCQRHIFYPRALCPHCQASDPDWVRASGEGVVYATSVVRRRPEKGGSYNVALIELKEGPRLMSRVDGLAPDAVAIGLAVEAQIGRKDDRPFLTFRPMSSEGGQGNG